MLLLSEGFTLTPVTTEDELNALEQKLGDAECMRDSLAWLQAKVFDSETQKTLDEARNFCLATAGAGAMQKLLKNI